MAASRISFYWILTMHGSRKQMQLYKQTLGSDMQAGIKGWGLIQTNQNTRQYFVLLSQRFLCHKQLQKS